MPDAVVPTLARLRRERQRCEFVDHRFERAGGIVGDVRQHVADVDRADRVDERAVSIEHLDGPEGGQIGGDRMFELEAALLVQQHQCGRAHVDSIQLISSFRSRIGCRPS
jgi:hypothetical protein